MSNVTEINKEHEELPQALLDELRASKPAGLNKKVEDILNSSDQVMTINDVLIAMYKQHNIIMKRTPMLAHLNKLKAAKKIKRVGVGKYKAATVQTMSFQQNGDST